MSISWTGNERGNSTLRLICVDAFVHHFDLHFGLLSVLLEQGLLFRDLLGEVLVFLLKRLDFPLNKKGYTQLKERT